MNTKELRELEAKATKGPWSRDIAQIGKEWLKGRLQEAVVSDSGVIGVFSENDPDAALIAAMRNALIPLLDENERLRAALREIEDHHNEYEGWRDIACTALRGDK